LEIKNAITILVVLLTLTVTFSGVYADCSPPIITVTSPQNNRVYPSNIVIPLNFSLIPSLGYNFSSYSYSIDGQLEQSIGDFNHLRGLSDGSHTVTIYGNGSWHGEFGNERIQLEIVYFSVGYSTAIVNFSVGLGIFLAFVSGVFFFGRRNIVARIKGKKYSSFWFGLMGLTVGVIIFSPALWWYLQLYLFPVNFHGMVVPPSMPMFFGALVMVFGFILTVFGTRKTANPKNSVG
jgi:hypothetical protein